MTVANQERRAPRGRGERGGARFNFAVTILLIALAAYSAYNYAPVWYKSYRFKDYMQETVNKAAFPPGQTTEWVTQQLRAGAKEHELPADAEFHVQREEGRIAARVTWSEPVQLPGYTYDYAFDHTARSSGYISQP
ncbi:MAG TPA: hypothetical protein VF659_05820 [Pyrinomonadaceae bacterium]|jgi:hypothetical protein